MIKRKAPEMPIVPTRSGQVERSNVYIRRNPQGQEELVTKKRGKNDEATLNELTNNLNDLLENFNTSLPSSDDLEVYVENLDYLLNII